MKIFKNCSYPYFFLLIFFSFSYTGSAQSEKVLQQLKDTTNHFYGSSDLLNLGELYVPEHLYATGHPYFITDEYAFASIRVNNNDFEKIKARYNIEKDQLIIRVSVDTGVFIPIITKEDWIYSFKIHDHYFVNIKGLQQSANVSGYCEEIYKGKKTFFIKYKKKFIDNYTDLSPNGFFSVLHKNKFIYMDKTFIPVNSKREFLKLFEPHKKSIKKFMRKNNIRYTSASATQMNFLMHYCDGL